MDFELSEDQILLGDTVTDVFERAGGLGLARQHWDDATPPDDDVAASLVAMGVAGLLVPDTVGGSGAGAVDAGVVCERVGRVCAPHRVESTLVAAELIRLVAAAGDADGLLGGVADGTVTVSAALDGVGSPVLDAAGATHLVVVDGDSVWLHDTSDATVVIEPTDTVDGTRCTATVTISPTQSGMLLGGDAAGAIAATRDLALALSVADGVGAASTCLDLAVAYATERRQFGAPIGSFQAVQHLCADMLAAREQAWASAFAALAAYDAARRAAADEGAVVVGVDHPAAVERHRMATLCKAYASDALFHVGADAIQVFAGIGFTWEHDIHLPYKRLMSLQHRGGGTRHHLEEIARLVID